MRFLITILIFFSLDVSSQESYMRWLGATDHYLGVYYVENEPNKEVWVRDTFAFVNSSNQEMVIQKAHVRNPEFFSFTKTIKPGQTGYIYYAERLNPYSDAIDTVEYRAVFPTNFSPWSMVTIHYFVVRGGVKKKLNSNGKVEKVISKNPNGFDYLELNLYPNGKPKSYGWKANENDMEILKWHYWNQDGWPENDSIFSKKMDITVLPNNAYYPIKCDVEVRVNGIWLKPFYRYANYSHTLFLTPGTDSIHLSSYAGDCYQVIKFQTYTSGCALQLFPIKSFDSYYYQSKIQIPLFYDKYVYAIIWKLDDPRKTAFPPVEKRIEELQLKYPEVGFKYLFEGEREIISVYLTNQAEEEFRLTLESISQEIYIDKLSQVFNVNRNPKPSYFQNTGIVKLPMYVKNEVIDSLLNLYGFERINNESYNAEYYATYKGKIINEDNLNDFNGLSNDPAFEQVNHWIMMIAEAGIDEVK